MEMEKSMQEKMELIKAETLKSIQQETQNIMNEIDEYNSYLDDLVQFIKSVYKEFNCIIGGGVGIVSSGRYNGETTSGYIQLSFCQNCENIRCIHIKPRLGEKGLYDINYYYDNSKNEKGNGDYIDIYRVLYGMERSYQLYQLNIGLERRNLLDKK